MEHLVEVQEEVAPWFQAVLLPLLVLVLLQQPRVQCTGIVVEHTPLAAFLPVEVEVPE